MICTLRSDLTSSACHYQNLYFFPAMSIGCAESLLTHGGKMNYDKRAHTTKVALGMADDALKLAYKFIERAGSREVAGKLPEYAEAGSMLSRIVPYLEKVGSGTFSASDVGKCEGDLKSLKKIMYGKADEMFARARSL